MGFSAGMTARAMRLKAESESGAWLAPQLEQAFSLAPTRRPQEKQTRGLGWGRNNVSQVARKRSRARSSLQRSRGESMSACLLASEASDFYNTRKLPPGWLSGTERRGEHDGGLASSGGGRAFLDLGHGRGRLRPEAEHASPRAAPGGRVSSHDRRVRDRSGFL